MSGEAKKGALRLLVRADDAGATRAINEGVLDAIERGIVRNVSVMAVGPALPHAIGLLAERREVALGLHVTINAEWQGLRWQPISAPSSVPSLVDRDGSFLPSPLILHERGFRVDEVIREARAQLERLRALQVEPSYLDTHMGFDWLDGVAEALANFCQEEGLVFDSARTHPRLPPHAGPLADRIAAHSGGPFVLITHPARPDPALDALWNKEHPPGVVTAARARERTELCDPRLSRLVEEKSLILLTYG